MMDLLASSYCPVQYLIFDVCVLVSCFIILHCPLWCDDCLCVAGTVDALLRIWAAEEPGEGNYCASRAAWRLQVHRPFLLLSPARDVL
jgi:hypothetical protein